MNFFSLFKQIQFKIEAYAINHGAKLSIM